MTITDEKLAEYANGNADVTLYADGTRIIRSSGELALEWPLNVDIRISERCSFGRDPRTERAVCAFCHESATTDGKMADLEHLYNTLSELPRGIELAIGVNQFDAGAIEFIQRCSASGWIVNCTVNQGHLGRDGDQVMELLQAEQIRGLGVSYRPGFRDIPECITTHPNTVVHVIAGIDDFQSVANLAQCGVQKLLVLGEKDFGFNSGRVRLDSRTHRTWYQRLHELLPLFKVVSFDNLALKQLNVRRFVVDWDTTYQGEYSFYINAVQQYFAPSSRSLERTHYDKGITIRDYFQSIQTNQTA